MNVIELDRATITIGGRDILVDTSFAIRRGEFIGVLGPNGAGKTTLMRAILGLLPPRAGSLRVFGRAPKRGDPQIGYLPQVRTVVPDLRVRGFDFIASSIHGERWGVPSLTRADRVMIEKTLAAIGAGDLAGRPLSDMSGGERQRLLLAQALLGEPQLLLLDEPLISLDYRYQEAVIDLVRSFARERNITVLFSAHELNQLIGTLDRVLYLGNGQAALGTVAEVATAPVLSKLYGTDIQVVHAEGHIFVLSRGRDVERSDHAHDDGHGHGHITITAITIMLDYDFMRNAFAAAGVAAVVSGLVGYFLVLRGQTFAGHALSHIGFAGATGAVLIGVASVWGLVGFTVAAGIGMGMLGERISGRDVAIGVVLSLALGFGLLFLHYYTAFATQATALLFGNVLAVDRSMIGTLVVLGVITLAGLAAIMRPLIFASLQPELAEAKGVPLRFVSTAFMAIVALAVAESAQIVGILLVFALMVGPPATAQRLVTGLWGGMLLSAVIALAEAWLGIAIAYHTDWPVSFCIAFLSALGYFLTRGNVWPRREATR